jgi:hypothetical protein
VSPDKGRDRQDDALAPCLRITTTGATFEPTVELAPGSTATVSWAVEGGATLRGCTPVIDFGTAAVRHVRLSVREDGGDALHQVTTLNFGFGHLDDSGTYNMGARHDKAGQKVTLVEGLPQLRGLIRFAAARTPLRGLLDFSGCSALEFVECFQSDVQSVNLTGCTSLVRLTMENANLSHLDLNPVAANLRDLRAAIQQSGTLTLSPLAAPLASLYHLCIRDQSVVNYPTVEQLPHVEERWDWNTNRCGALVSASRAIRSLRTFHNSYTTADLTDQFPAGCDGVLEAGNNQLTAVDLTGCSGLQRIDLRNNRLSTAAVDTVLGVAASWATSGGTLDLSGNGIPSVKGAAAVATLRERGWVVHETA